MKSDDDGTVSSWLSTPPLRTSVAQAPMMTHEQYVDMLIDTSFREAAEMESGFMVWCAQHVPIWRKLGHDETWIRLRVATAQRTHGLHRTLKEQGLTILQMRDELHKQYSSQSELYNLAQERARSCPGLLRYRGTMADLLHRSMLRVMVYETDKLAYEQYCRKYGLPTPRADKGFCEQPDAVRVIRDLSTVEELEEALAMSTFLLHLFDEPERLTAHAIASRMETYGKHRRTTFLATYGYLPEDSAVPYIPVTVDGPQDHQRYYAKEYPT